MVPRLGGLFLTGVVSLIACGMLASCGPSPSASPDGAQAVQAAPSSQPASQPILPEKAAVSLDAITPSVAKPVNPAGVDEVPERAAGLLSEADELIKNGDFAGAITRLDRAVGFAPDNARIRKSMGVAYAGMSDAGKSAENMRRCLKTAPDTLEARVILGRIAVMQKRHDEAMTQLRIAVKCSKFGPESPWAAEALLLLGGELDDHGYWQAAAECMETLNGWIDSNGRDYVSNPLLKELVLRPERLLIERGRLLLKLRRSEPAAELLERAFRRDRTQRQAAALLVDAMVQLRRFGDAEKLLGELSAEQSHRDALAGLAEKVCLASGDKEMPGRLWQSYRQKNRQEIDIALAVSLARVAERLGGPDRARAILEPLREEMPGGQELAEMLARIYAGDGKYQQAFGVLAEAIVADDSAAAAADKSLAEMSARLPGGYERQAAAWADKDASASAFAAHYVAGVVARQAGKEFVAAEQFDKALRVKKDFAPAYEALVDLHLSAGRFDDADKVVRRLMETKADSYLGFYLQGKVRVRRGDYAPAADSLVQAISRNGAFMPARVLLVRAFDRAGQPAQADRTVRELANSMFDDWSVMRFVFDRYIGRGEYAQARDMVRNMLARKPEGKVGRMLQAELLVLFGDVEQASPVIDELAKAYPHDVDVELLTIRMSAQGSNGRMLLPRATYLRVVRRLSEILRADPSCVSAGRLLTQLLFQMDESTEAVAVLDRLRRAMPDDMDADRSYLAGLMVVKQYADAVTLADRLLSQSPGDDGLRAMLLSAMVGQKKADDAIARATEWINDAADSDGKTRARINLLRAYEQAERYDAAVKLLDEWIPQDAQRQGVLEANRIRILSLAGKIDRAVELAEPWIKQAPEDMSRRQTTIAMLVKAKAYDKIESLARAWLAGDPEGKYAQTFRVMLLMAMAEHENFSAVLDLAKTWVAQTPYDAAVRRHIVGVLADKQRYDDARKLVDGWLAELSADKSTSRPANFIPTLNACRGLLVQVMLSSGQAKEALAKADEFLTADPNDKDILNVRASCLSELDRTAESLSVIEKVYSLDPDDPGANNNLGYNYAEAGMKLDLAEAMIRKAMEAHPDSVAVRDSLAWVLYKQGKISEAGGLFQIIVAADDEDDMDDADNVVICDHAGDAYYRLGWTDLAAKMWRRSADSGKKVKTPSRDVRRAIESAGAKLAAVKAGKPAMTAPLAPGVKA